jgi:hypothetical protein
MVIAVATLVVVLLDVGAGHSLGPS